MARTRNHLQCVGGLEKGGSPGVQFEHINVLRADDQECGTLDISQNVKSQIGTATSRYDGANASRAFNGCFEARCSTSTGTEKAEGKLIKVRQGR